MGFLRISYYPDVDSGPVKDYLNELARTRKAAFHRLCADMESLGGEGLRSGRIAVRPMGQGLWELKRRFDGIQYRIFFCVERKTAWLLHAIEKKSAKTPLDDLKLARRRMRRIAP